MATTEIVRWADLIDMTFDNMEDISSIDIFEMIEKIIIRLANRKEAFSSEIKEVIKQIQQHSKALVDVVK